MQEYGEEKEKPLPPLRLTYARHTLKYDWAFRSLEFCATFEFAQVIHIDWHGVDADLQALLSVGDSEAKEPVGKEARIMRSVKGIREQTPYSLKPYTWLKIKLKTIQVHEIYVGPDSTFCDAYPPHVRPYFPAYDMGHCVDLLYLQWLFDTGKMECYRKYKTEF